MAGSQRSPDPTPTRRSRGIGRAPEAHRFTVRVPLADTSVVDWWEAQYDPSASVRTLIRDEIVRHGYTDTVNRPIAQQPRRGRPPLSESGDDEYAAPAADLPAGTAGAAVPVWPVAPILPAPAAPAAPAGPTPVAAPIVEAQAVPPQALPLDMEDIFGHGT